MPPGLGGSHGSHTTSFHYFYMWRFGWVFLLMTLFFEVLAFFTSILACCGRLGAALAFVVSAIALFFYTLAVSIITYVNRVISCHGSERVTLLTVYCTQCHILRSPQPVPRRWPVCQDRTVGLRFPLGLVCGTSHCCHSFRAGHTFESHF